MLAFALALALRAAASDRASDALSPSGGLHRRLADQLDLSRLEEDKGGSDDDKMELFDGGELAAKEAAVANLRASADLLAHRRLDHARGLAAILFLVRKRVVAARQHRRESMPTVGETRAKAEA